jgi:hypothetical protein
VAGASRNAKPASERALLVYRDQDAPCGVPRLHWPWEQRTRRYLPHLIHDAHQPAKTRPAVFGIYPGRHSQGPSRNDFGIVRPVVLAVLEIDHHTGLQGRGGWQSWLFHWKQGKIVASGALPWFESYADQDWITKMLLRHMG